MVPDAASPRTRVLEGVAEKHHMSVSPERVWHDRWSVNFDRSRSLNERLHRVIPGGAHTYAKGDDQFPEGLAPVVAEGRGCRVRDVDGNEFIEFGMGLRAVTLGHAHAGVARAVAAELERGFNFTRPALLELSAAERLLEILPNADMVKFAKGGSQATTAAVRLARAATGRDLIAICGSQPFFSIDDWFIGSTPMSAGIPASVRALTVTFPYDDIAALKEVLANHPSQIAAVMMEPATTAEPSPGYLQAVRRLCDANGALFILDETITGFRWHLSGAQCVYGVSPDLAIFGKGLGNGVAIAALVGRREIMELGGTRHDGDRVFLLSTTHGAESLGLAAAMAVMSEYQASDVVGTLHRQGARLARGVSDAAASAGVGEEFQVIGRPCNLVFATLGPDGRRSQAFRTLFLQEMIWRGVLAPSFVVSVAHDDATIDAVVDRVGEALRVYRQALEDGVERHLEGRSVQPVMRRRNHDTPTPLASGDDR